MPKGFFTQCIVILFEKTPTIQDIQLSIQGSKIVKEVKGGDSWAISGDSILVEYDKKLNGYCTIDIVDRKWPDGMGDPKQSSDIFCAWTMGHFGPFTYPGALERAQQQAWHWNKAPEISNRHTAFVRVRYSYAFGAKDDQPIIPEGYDSRGELRHAIELAYKIMNLKHCLCMFNPNGEILINSEMVKNALTRTDRLDIQDVWCNVRMFNDGKGNLVFDTKGLGQIDLMDHEITINEKKCNPTEIASFLRNIASYTYANGEVIKDGNTIDGPQMKKWKCRYQNESTLPGPREVISWKQVRGFFG